jgi:hypothetical protein
VYTGRITDFKSQLGGNNVDQAMLFDHARSILGDDGRAAAWVVRVQNNQVTMVGAISGNTNTRPGSTSSIKNHSMMDPDNMLNKAILDITRDSLSPSVLEYLTYKSSIHNLILYTQPSPSPSSSEYQVKVIQPDVLPLGWRQYASFGVTLDSKLSSSKPLLEQLRSKGAKEPSLILFPMENESPLHRKNTKDKDNHKNHAYRWYPSSTERPRLVGLEIKSLKNAIAVFRQITNNVLGPYASVFIMYRNKTRTVKEEKEKYTVYPFYPPPPEV